MSKELFVKQGRQALTINMRQNHSPLRISDKWLLTSFTIVPTLSASMPKRDVDFFSFTERLREDIAECFEVGVIIYLVCAL